MTIFSVIAYTSLFIAIVSIYFAITRTPHYYWVGALSIYIFSFLAGFSIGQWTVGITFVPLMMAIAHTCHFIHTRKHSMIFFAVGCIIGVGMVVFVGNRLFYPLLFFFH